jgi:hypothetical protein
VQDFEFHVMYGLSASSGELSLTSGTVDKVSNMSASSVCSIINASDFIQLKCG